MTPALQPSSITRDSLRNSIRQNRRALSPKQQAIASVELSAELSKVIKEYKAQNIAIYLSNDGELNTENFIKWCWAQNIKTYLPVIHPFSKGHLLFLQYHPNTAMKANQYGILEPKLNVLDIIPLQGLDIIFTPLVAFDETGNRIGMGGGFYDRTLAKWYQHLQHNVKTKPQPVGIAHDCQKVEHIPIETWDIPLPEIITPTQHYYFNIK